MHERGKMSQTIGSEPRPDTRAITRVLGVLPMDTKRINDNDIGGYFGMLNAY
jgi:hypothetical protein